MMAFELRVVLARRVPRVPSRETCEISPYRVVVHKDTVGARADSRVGPACI